MKGSQRLHSNRHLVLLTVLVVALVLPAYLNAYSSIDRFVYEFTPRSESTAVKLVTHTASIGAFLAYSAIMLIYDYYRYKRLSNHTLIFLVALALSIAVVALLKATTRVPRPEFVVAENKSVIYLIAHVYAFPSGHTTRAAVLACVVSRRFNIPLKYTLLYPIVIGATRMLLGVHWFSDVLAAITIGCWIAVLSEKICSKLAISNREQALSQLAGREG